MFRGVPSGQNSEEACIEMVSTTFSGLLKSDIVFVLVKEAIVNVDEGFKAIEGAVDHLCGVRKRVVVKLLYMPFSVFNCHNTP
jgi:hypothetical protein